MMRGARVTVPPLHSLADVLGLCLLLVVLFLVVRWLTGSSPIQDLAKVLSPPALATLLVIEVGIEGEPAEISTLLPMREKAGRTAAVQLAQRLGGALDGARGRWRYGALRSTKVKEADGLAAWEAAWQHASQAFNGQSEGAAPVTMVTIIALVTGRSLRMPRRVTAGEVARFVKGIGALDVRYLDAFGAMASPAVASAAGAQALGLVAL